MTDLYRLMREEPRRVVDLISGLVYVLTGGEGVVTVHGGAGKDQTLYVSGAGPEMKLWVEPR